MTHPHNSDLARVLASSWRIDAPQIQMSSDILDALLPTLLIGKLAGLALNRLRGTPLAESSAAGELRDRFRGNALRDLVDEESIVQVIADLREAGIEAVILKGWAVARLYSDPALRPYGDLDLAVLPAHLTVARTIVARYQDTLEIDLDHADVGLLSSSAGGMLGRSQRVSLHGVEVRVLSAEDQLRLLCLHFLRHGGWRPLWLVDIAVALETRPPNFDWHLCLGADARVAGGIACAIGLTRHLLGVDVGGTPVASGGERLPRWFVRTVLKGWEKPHPMQHPPMNHREPIASLLRRPTKLVPALWQRRPDPISATAAVGGPYNNVPRSVYQARYVAQRVRRFVKTGAPR